MAKGYIKIRNHAALSRKVLLDRKDWLDFMAWLDKQEWTIEDSGLRPPPGTKVPIFVARHSETDDEIILWGNDQVTRNPAGDPLVATFLKQRKKGRSRSLVARCRVPA
jgi:hypothetical protein